jgi:hypothetical protein
MDYALSWVGQYMFVKLTYKISISNQEYVHVCANKCINFESSWFAYFLWLLLLPNMFKEKNIIAVHKKINDVVWEILSRC